VRRTERDDRRPFFLVVAPAAPHRPYVPADRHLGAAVPGWPATPAGEELDRSDKPPYVQRFRFGPRLADRIIQAQQRSLLAVDDLVGRVFDALRENGEDRRTLAFFLSDNGYQWGEHGLRDIKNVPYTESVTVPFLLRWPGRVPPGATDRRIATNLDLAPTVLEAAGVTPDPLYPFDGHSLLAPPSRDRVLLEYWRDAPTGVPNWASVRTAAFQYVEIYEDDAATVVFREYYDLRRDPFQLRNLLGDDDPGNDPNTAELSRTLSRDRSCSGEACP
jgi:arylsulfatase A-like enzyme